MNRPTNGHVLHCQGTADGGIGLLKLQDMAVGNGIRRDADDLLHRLDPPFAAARGAQAVSAIGHGQHKLAGLDLPACAATSG